MTIAPTKAKELYAAAHSLSDTIALFSAMAHPCRLRVLILLAEEQVCDVTTLTHLCGKRQSYISQQLRILRDVGLVIGSQEGQRVCYRITNERVRAILQAAGVLEHGPMMPGQ